MKKSILVVFCILSSFIAHAVTLEISDGIYDQTLKKKIEHNASVFLTEINRQYTQNAVDLNFQQVLRALPSDMQRSVGMLWAASPFKCTQENITSRLLNSSTGYQIRNIPLFMKVGGDAQEGVINFDRNGRIVSFHTALLQTQYQSILENADRVTDLERRQQILDFVEQYRTAWMSKDSVFIDQIFSEDALIITGTVVKQKSQDGMPLPDKIKYSVKTKEAYLKSLKRSFKKYSAIRVSFEEIEIVRHHTYSNYYGVTLKQYYSADGVRQNNGYSDVGYVFLLWKFPKEGESDYPMIYVRTWQPESFPKALPGIDDFDEGFWE